MKTFKIRRSNIILFLMFLLPVFFGAGYGVLSMIQEGRYGSFQDKITIILVIGCMAFLLYGVVYAFLFRVNIDESIVEIRRPPLSWAEQRKFTLRWDEIEKVVIGLFLLPEAKPFILKPRRETGKKNIRISPAMNNFPELMKIVLEKVPVENTVRSEIERQIHRFNHKWPLSLPWTIALVTIAIIVVINLIATLLRWPQ